MTKNLVAFTIVLILSAGYSHRAIASDSARPTTIRIACLDVARIRRSWSRTKDLDLQKIRTTHTLNLDRQIGIERVQQMRKEGKPQAEIDNVVADEERRYLDKMEAFSMLVLQKEAMDTLAIAKRARSVARDRGLDLILDPTSIFFERSGISEYFEDITDAVLKALEAHDP